MYAVIAEQNSAIFNKLSGKDKHANEQVEELRNFLIKAEEEINIWLEGKKASGFLS